MAYQMNMSATNPGLVIFLLDQSGSMEDEFQGESLARGQKLMDAVAAIVNKTIHKIGLSCVKGDVIRPRVDIAVIGYNGAQGVHSALPDVYGGKEIVSIAELMERNLRVEERKQKVYSPETGEYQDISIQFPIWFDPCADGGTPMCGALTKAVALAESWIAAHQESFPPILINITDGAANDSDPQPAAEGFRALCTADGNGLVFNCHICRFPNPDGVSYPESVDRLPAGSDESLLLAQALFNMSSELPGPMFELAKAKVNPNIQPGARGYVFNADVSGIIDMITIVTSVASTADTAPTTSAFPASDPNR
jgi:hypothetical protein